MKEKAFLILESGQCFSGQWLGGEERAGEVVFNTSHTGYEEMATDPSYFSQIIVTTASMQGNYGVDDKVWESSKLWINGFVCLEMQNSRRDSSWLQKLVSHGVPVVDQIDTRQLTLFLRESGTMWGALVRAGDETSARERAKGLISKGRQLDGDWANLVSRKESEDISGDRVGGPRVAVIDFGCKNNILRELRKRCSKVKIFPSRVSVDEIRQWAPDGILLSNGPGDPALVEKSVETVRSLLGWRFIFGICMGNQILGMALGAKTYKLKFGHRGSNHPVRDKILNRIYVTSQNHGYALDPSSLPDGVIVSHVNLNDDTVSGITCVEKKCWGVQFHPESHPGPHDAEGLFDYFIKQLL